MTSLHPRLRATLVKSAELIAGSFVVTLVLLAWVSS